MRAYLLAVAGAVLLSALLSLLVPEGKTGAFVKGCGRLVVVLSVVSPLLSLFSGKPQLFTSAEVGGDEGYLGACARILSEESGREIGRYLSEEFSVTAVVTAEHGTEEGFPLRKITVKIDGTGIFGQDGHIDMAERVKSALEARYGCEAEVGWLDG